MKTKTLIIGALAAVGGFGLYMWLKKPKKNNEGFYNASGSSYVCVKTNKDGSRTITSSLGDCPKGSTMQKANTSISSVM